MDPVICQCGCGEEILDPWKHQRFKDQDHYNRYRVGKGRKKRPVMPVDTNNIPSSLANLKLGDILSLHLENIRLKDIEYKYSELKEELKQLIHKYNPAPVITSPPETPAPKSPASKSNKVFVMEDGSHLEDGEPISKDRISPYIRGTHRFEEPESTSGTGTEEEDTKPVIQIEKVLDEDDPIIPEVDV